MSVKPLFVICSLLGALPLPLLANCIKVTSINSLSAEAKAEGYTAASWAGACDTCNGNPGLPAVVSVNSGDVIQPAGTLIASGIGNFLTGSSNVPWQPKQVLFRCESGDENKLYEMYATNGDSAYAGHNAANEVEGAWYDAFKNVAVRLTNLATGEYYSRYWKARQLTRSDWYQDSKYIYIPASAFSNVLYEMFKISGTSYYLNGSSWYKDTHSQPRGYMAFKGPGLDTDALKPDADSSSVWNGWYANWPAAWSSYNYVTYVRGAFCQVKDYPSLVTLSPITSAELLSGNSSQTPFSLSIECESGARSGTATSDARTANVAMGFLVNQPTAVSAAQKLNLTTAGGGLTWLLDNNYGGNGVAQGVGIRIHDRNNQTINLLPGLAKTGNGNSGGWYGYQQLTSQTASGTLSTWSGDFTASLEAIPGQTITPGSVNAQLQIMVSFQ